MQRNTVIDKVGRLEKYFDKNYTTDQLEIIYQELKDMPEEKLERAIKETIRNCKYLPKIADIIEASNSKNGINIQEERERIACEKCGGTGYVTYWKEIEGRKYEFGALCKCGNEKQYKGWECPEARYRTQFYTPLAEDLHLI